jgi:methionyl-tRNA synthetase
VGVLTEGVASDGTDPEEPFMDESEAFRISEGIARGDECESCGAAWEDGELIHADTCEYWEYVEVNDG